MLFTPPLEHKVSVGQSKSAELTSQYRCDSADGKLTPDTSQTCQINSSRGTSRSGLDRSASHKSSNLSRPTVATSSKKAEKLETNVEPFISKYGRQYLSDETLPYPLPSDVAELHRQTLRTMLFCQVFGGPLCSPHFKTKPPLAILEVACGTGYWSQSCHRYFSEQGHKSISFTGIDIAPLDVPDKALQLSSMNWRFIQHDLRQVPLPFEVEEFCIIMIKDFSMVTTIADMEQILISEFLRILKPGGTIEIWDGDHSPRMLLPHAQTKVNCKRTDAPYMEELCKTSLGNYLLTQKTKLAAPKNQYLNDFSVWVTKMLKLRNLSPVPSDTILHLLTGESSTLQEIDSLRLAIPLGEVRWENECKNKGGAGKGHASDFRENGSKHDTSGSTQLAIRRTALMTIIQLIESLEPLLRNVSGKGEDEWNSWMERMMSDLLEGNGGSWGECLEIGAWWSKKKIHPFSL